MTKTFDIDIDITPISIDEKESLVEGLRTAIWDQEREAVHPHPSGFILGSEAPQDALTGLCSIPSDEVEDYGFHKIDLINSNYLSRFNDQEDFLYHLEMEPDWSQLLNKDITNKLPHIHNHFELIEEIKPSSVQELADCLALIRPDKKKYLIDYRKNPEETRPYLYEKQDKDSGSFKKSHAISYSLLIVAVLNKITKSSTDQLLYY